MNFFKYPSLTSHYAIGKDKRISNMYDDNWFSTEKIHGANVSIVVDKFGEISFGKRTSFIDSSDNQFTKFVQFVKEEPELVADISKFLSWEHVTQVHAFGEYFGAGVQAMDYTICKEATIDVKLFNIVLEYADGAVYYVVSRDTVDKYVNKKYLTSITGRDTLRNFLSAPLEVQSTYGGISEGQVYQPTVGYILSDKSRFCGVKHKTLEFSEVKQKTKVKTKVEYTPEFLALIEDVSCYVTANRLANVLSHGEYELENKNIGSIMQALKTDIITEFQKENTSLFTEKEITSAVNKNDRTIALLIKDAIDKDSMKVLGSL